MQNLCTTEMGDCLNGRGFCVRLLLTACCLLHFEVPQVQRAGPALLLPTAYCLLLTAYCLLHSEFRRNPGGRT
jgi:hypothetical protein